MPHRHPDTERWGGPGASHEDRTKPRPPGDKPGAPMASADTRHSAISGGGGEPDRHHGHDPEAKRDRQQNSVERGLMSRKLRNKLDRH
jgi:hypothetical protein